MRSCRTCHRAPDERQIFTVDADHFLAAPIRALAGINWPHTPAGIHAVDKVVSCPNLGRALAAFLAAGEGQFI